MNKESIYKIIGYNGEYNSSVKRAIRKLLKTNHPDNNGDRRIFELICEVKEELENNKVTYSSNKNVKSSKLADDIDYDYCYGMINKLTKQKKIYTNDLKKKNEQLAKYMNEYKNNYRKSIDLETYLLNNTQYMDQLKKTKILCVAMLVLALIIFTLSVFKRSIILFIMFVLVSFICVLTIHKSFFIIKKLTDNNQNKIKNYVSVNNDLRTTEDAKDALKKDIYDLEKKINNLDNDLRFYNNLIK